MIKLPLPLFASVRLCVKASVGLSLLFAAVLAGLGSYGGILDPTTRLIGLIAFAALVIVWARFGRGVRARTVFDRVLFLWVLAFAISFVANLEAWRRTLTALWYMGLYVALWYLLHDLITARRLRREMLVDALLIGGGVVVLHGWLLVAVGISRPPGMLGNANTLAAFLIILIPFGLGRTFTVKMLWLRLALAVYSLAALGLLALTFSRSAWIALGAALLVQAALNGRARWSQWGRGVRAVMMGAAVLMMVMGAVLLARSFSLGGRTLDLRTDIYEAALHIFAEKPLTGYGLFTFGRELPRFWSTPPFQVHSHAHSVPLQIAAELGIPGFIAFAITVFIFLRAMRANYRADADARPLIASGIAASLAFGLHHLADVPAMNPAIALAGLVALVVSTSSPDGRAEARPYKIVSRRDAPAGAAKPPSVELRSTPCVRVRLYPALVALLLLTGLWDTILYTRYNGILWAGMNGGDPRQTAGQLQPIIDADPALAIYHQQQGFFYALAGDFPAAIDAYGRFVALEPNSAVGWANLAALRWETGEHKAATDLMRRAVRLAPRAWSLAFRLGIYAEESGDTEVARSAYREALYASPDVEFYPGWANTPIQQEVTEGRTPTEAGAILQALEQNEAQLARDLWESSAFSHHDSTESNVVNALLLIAEGQPDEAEIALQRAQSAAANDEDEAWLRVGEARLARARGDEAATESALAAAREIVTADPMEADYEAGANVAYVQFFRMAVPRQFLPQVGYEQFTPTLLYVVSRAED